MDEFIERIYLEELTSQCALAISSFQRMETMLRDHQKKINTAIEVLSKSRTIDDVPEMPENINDPFFAEASALLQHAALASKLLWPMFERDKMVHTRANERGEHLRNVLDVNDDHILRKRDLRNHFEHFDTRLDDWVHTCPTRLMVDRNISSGPLLRGPGAKDLHVFKHYNPATKHLTFRDEIYSMHELVDGLGDIRNRVEQRLAELPRLTST